MNITVKPPDVNESEAGFTVTDDGLRFGLAAVKGVGTRAGDGITEARQADGPFESLFDFCSRVDPRLANKAVIEALVKCGAFDSLGGHRSQYVAVVDRAISAGQRMRADRQSGQTTFFEQFASAVPAQEVAENLPGIPEWTEQELLAAEKATIGFYLTTHPLAKHADELNRFANTDAGRLHEFEDGTELTLGGMLSQVRVNVVQKGRSAGERMARMSVEDLSGKCEAVAWPEVFVRNESLVRNESVVFIRGRLDLRREPPSIVISDMIPIDQAPLRLADSVAIRLDERHQDEHTMEELRRLLSQHRGDCNVYLEVVSTDQSVTRVRADSSFSVTPDTSFAETIAEFLGEGHLSFNAIGPRKRSFRNGGRNWRRN